VLRLRLFPRRAVLARLRVFGRRADIRLDLPFAVIGVPAMLALFTALGTALRAMLWMRGVLRIFALGVTLTVAEWLRGHVLTGFPWNAFGYALASPLALAQSAALVGLWGLTSSPSWCSRVRRRSPMIPPKRRGRGCRSSSRRGAGGMGGFGALRLLRTPTRLVDKVHLRIMQPNLQQDIRFNYAARREVMNRYVTLSDRRRRPGFVGMKDVTHLIWPESPFPFFLAREPDALAQITQLLPPGARC